MLKLIDRAVAYKAGAVDAKVELQMTSFKERRATKTKTIAARENECRRSYEEGQRTGRILKRINHKCNSITVRQTCRREEKSYVY